ncbi:MAG: protein jag [Thermoanaerobaculia bacterium]
MGSKKFFSGNTLEQALLQAARHFQLEPDEVSYEQVDRRHGFLKVRRRVVIGVDPDSPGEPGAPVEARLDEVAVEPPAEGDGPSAESEGPIDEAAAAPAETAAKEPVAAADRETVVWNGLTPTDASEAAEEALRRLFRLGDLSLEAEIGTGDQGLEVELRGDDEDQLFEDRGRLLMAIQHLLPRMIRGLTGGSAPCRVDSDNFHEVRQEQLRVMAQDAAAEVRRDRRMQTLEPMSPDERRIVHLTLADDPAVETESHGSGLFKRVAIRPVRRSERGGDRYNR